MKGRRRLGTPLLSQENKIFDLSDVLLEKWLTIFYSQKLVI